MKGKISLVVALTADNSYVIQSVTNSTDYKPGYLIEPTKLDALIARGITVKIVKG